MLIKIICIIALLEFSLSEEYNAKILPMDKDSKYGDDICSYTDNNQTYVKLCEKGKFCDTSNTLETLDYSRGNYYSGSKLEICQDLPNVTSFYTYKGSCTNDFECEAGYECIENTCSYKCPNDAFIFKLNDDSSPTCTPNTEKGTDGICLEETRVKDAATTIKYSPPVPNKICGKLTLLDDPNDDMKGIYYVNKYEYVYKGEVEDGEYVTNEELCKSGFALYFFKGGKSKDPKDASVVPSSENNIMHLRCVTPISIISEITETIITTPTPSVTVTVDQCSINYKINEDGEILKYNIEQLTSGAEKTFAETYCKSDDKLYIKLKHEKYREFYANITEEERETCGDLDYANKYTCENNELIKSWYFYKHPKDFTTYNDRKKIGKVIDYKIQKEYPCYSLSKFLVINFIYLLFLLLF